MYQYEIVSMMTIEKCRKTLASIKYILLYSIPLDASWQAQKNGLAQVCSDLQAVAPRALTFSVVSYAIRQLSWQFKTSERYTKR